MQFTVIQCEVYSGKKNTTSHIHQRGLRCQLQTRKEVLRSWWIVQWKYWSNVQQLWRKLLHVRRKGLRIRLIRLCCPSVVWLHLEDCVHFWSPHVQENIVDIVEPGKVQKRTTKMIRGLEHLPVKKGLQYLGPFSLGKKVIKWRIIETWNYATWEDCGKINTFLPFSQYQNQWQFFESDGGDLYVKKNLFLHTGTQFVTQKCADGH